MNPPVTGPFSRPFFFVPRLCSSKRWVDGQPIFVADLIKQVLVFFLFKTWSQKKRQLQITGLSTSKYIDPKRNWRWKTQQLGTPTHNHQTFPKKDGMTWKPFCIIVAISLMANINIVSASNHRSSSAASCGRKNYAGMASSYLCPTSFLWHDSGSNHFNRFMEENNSTWRFDLYLKKLILSFQILVHWRC